MTPHDNTRGEANDVLVCPVEGCSKENEYERGIYLHILWSVGNGHGEQGEVPEKLGLEEPPDCRHQGPVINYPDDHFKRIARLCPYCGDPFYGKNGVLIHLGKVAGGKNHPVNASEVHEPEDFTVVELDNDENIVGVVNSGRASSEEAPEESESDEAGAVVTLPEDQFEYLRVVIYEQTDDERARQILRKVHFSSGGG